MPRKKTGLASSTKKRYIKSTCHCLILCQNIVGGLYTIISEGKFTQSTVEGTVEILFGIVYTETILTIADFQKRGKYYEEKIIQEQYR